MEELGRTSRLARRMALAAMICCTTSTGYAADPPTSESTQPQTFRSLLTTGWSGSKALESTSSPVAKTPEATQPSAAAAGEEAVIVRSKLRVTEVPASVLATTEQPEQIAQPIKAADAKPEIAAQQIDTSQSAVSVAKKEEKAAAASVPTTLAELIQRRTIPLQVPVLNKDSGAIQYEIAPSVNRLDIGRQIAASAARQSEASAAVVQVATPIKGEPPIAEPPIAEALLAEAPIALPVNGEAENIASAVAQDVPENAKSAELSSDAPATSVIVKSAPIEAPLREAQTPVTSAPVSLDTVPSPSIESEVVGSVPSDRSRRVASDNGFGLFPLDSFESDAAVELGSGRDETSLTATINSTRLRELARESLRNSSHRMQRQATHSAKKYALEALRSIVAMRDAEAGGNQRAKQLDVALDAIRESDDFCGRFGPVDQNALKRMVAVHETDVLKGRDLENISALEATETYLAVAKKNLTAAAGGVREASDALVLLGNIEKQMSNPGDTHAAAVAVTLQRAAIEVAPTNGSGYRELGSTLLDQGLVKQAAWALGRSVEIQPTRSGYEGLLEASRRLGDVETARLCLESLQNPNISSETPVKTLSPDAFAATYKPNLNELKTATPKPQPLEADAHKAEQTRISLRTLFPFGRR